MTTLHQQLGERYEAHCAGNPDAAYARRAFEAGAKAGLEIAASFLAEQATLRSHPHGIGALNNASVAVIKLAKEIQ